MSDEADRRRVRRAAVHVGLLVGAASAVVVTAGVALLVAVLLLSARPELHHNGEGVFANLPNPFNVTRYHSLIIERETLPSDLTVTAWAGENHEIMGVRHKTFNIEGVHFHPESILSENGHALLKNFLDSSG